MLKEMKDKAKKDQLMNLIAMLNDQILESDVDRDDYAKGDVSRLVDKVEKEQKEGKEDERREMTEDMDPREDMREDDRRHAKRYEQDTEDLAEDMEDEEEGKEATEADEEEGLREQMKEFLGGRYRLPEEVSEKKSRRMFMRPERPEVRMEAMVAKMEEPPRRGRKKKR